MISSQTCCSQVALSKLLVGDDELGRFIAFMRYVRRAAMSFSERVETLKVVAELELTVVADEGSFSFVFVFHTVHICRVAVVWNIETEPMDNKWHRWDIWVRGHIGVVGGWRHLKSRTVETEYLHWGSELSLGQCSNQPCHFAKQLL